MTEKEWLTQSDEEKNFWILYQTGHRCKNGLWWKGDQFLEHHAEWVLNWQGFGMIVEKLGEYTSNHYEGWYEVYREVGGGEDYYNEFFGRAKTPWEAAALAYGKMKGLIK